MTSDDQYPTTSDAVRAAIEAEEAGQQADDQEASAPPDLRESVRSWLAGYDARRQAATADRVANSEAMAADLGLSPAEYAAFLAMPEAQYQAMWRAQMISEGWPDPSTIMGSQRIAMARHAGIPIEMPKAPVRPTLLQESAGNPALLAAGLGGRDAGFRTAAEVAEDERAAGLERDPETGEFVSPGSLAQAAAGIRAATGRGPKSGTPPSSAPAAVRPSTVDLVDRYQPSTPAPSSGNLLVDQMSRLLRGRK